MLFCSRLEFGKFHLRFLNFLSTAWICTLKFNLTATCHKLEGKWEELSWKAALISYSVGYLGRMAGGNHVQHVFALFPYVLSVAFLV